MDRSNLNISGIYAIINKLADRVYVGSAVNIRTRWNHHRRKLRDNTHHSPILQSSWNKHGEAAFSIFVLETHEGTGQLISREQLWIDCLSALTPGMGYNVAPKAGSMAGFKFSAESRAKMSASKMGRKGHPISPEHRAKMDAGYRAKKPFFPKIVRTEEHKEKQRQTMIGRKLTEGHKAKLRAVHERRRLLKTRFGGIQLKLWS